MSTPSKKRRVIPLQDKKRIIARVDEKKSYAEIGTEFGGLSKSTISTILKERKAVLSANEEGRNAKRARMKTAAHDDLEESVLQWLKDARSENIPVNGPLLTEKARKLAAELAKQIKKALKQMERPLDEANTKLEERIKELEDFKASEGWLTNFKTRHSITFKSNQGESANIDLEALGNWQEQVLREIIAAYSPNDVFNVDETGLFWHLLPSKTLAFKGERCTSGKKSKERITVLVGSNMSGTEKLPLLVIGKSNKPRCFKNEKIPLKYKANSKAWMTGAFFEDWLKEWDRKLKKEGRKVLLYVDNCSAHPKITLDNIVLKFFPPNTTAASQPMDQGIIENVKVHYRRFLLRARLSAMENKKMYKVDLLQALHFLRRSWDAVKSETLSRCFRKAGFVIYEEEVPEVQEEHEEDINELNEMFEKLVAAEETDGDLLDYLRADNDLATNQPLTLEEIAEANSQVEEPEMEEADAKAMEVEIVEEQPTTALDALNGFKVFQRYMETHDVDPAMLRKCDELDEFLAKERIKKMKQNQITNYFCPAD